MSWSTWAASYPFVSPFAFAAPCVIHEVTLGAGLWLRVLVFLASSGLSFCSNRDCLLLEFWCTLSGGYGNFNLISIARCLRAASSWRRSGMSLYLSSFACMTALPRSRALVSCVRLRLCSPHLASALWKPSRCRCIAAVV